MAWLLGRADTLWHIALANGAQWLLGGACIGIVGAIVGAQADAGHRGRLFGVLGIMIPLGSLVGGLTFGRMVDAWGYPGMSTAVAAFCLIVPAAALLLVREDTAAPVGPEKAPAKVPSGAQWISGTLLLLLCAEILAMIATGVGNMGRSISMHERAFSNGAITTTTAVGGIVSLPIPFVMGWLSDRLGRRKIMNATFLAGTAGVVLLLISRSLWHFCAVAAFMSLNSVSMTVGPAYVADIVKKERRGTGVALLQCSAWIGMIIGYVYSGIAFQRFGMVVGLASAAAVPVLGILVLSFVRTGTGRDMGTRRPLGETVEGT
jgi:MFS family permease